jgi:hypothetical protein
MAIDDMTSRYVEMRRDLCALLDQSVAASHFLASLTSASEREHNASLIFAKLVGHGISLYRLTPSGMVPEKPGATEFWDVSSSFCLCRALIEAFDALAYVALEEITEEERTFRVCLWQLHADDRKLQALKLIQSQRPELDNLEVNINRLRAQLQKSPFVVQLDKHARNEVFGKRIQPFHIRSPERNRRNGVNHEYYTASHILLSAHTHTYPMAVEQLANFRAGDEESLRLIALSTQYATGFISKGLLGINRLFSEVMPPLPEAVAEIVGIWSGVVENGVSMIDTY